MPVVKTSSKGQVVIPVEIRRKLGIKPGRMVNMTLEGDRAVISPLPEDPIKALRGALKGKPSLIKALLKDREKEQSKIVPERKPLTPSPLTGEGRGGGE